MRIPGLRACVQPTADRQGHGWGHQARVSSPAMRWVREPAGAANKPSGLGGGGVLGGYAEPPGTGIPWMPPPAVARAIVSQGVVGAYRPGEDPGGEFSGEE